MHFPRYRLDTPEDCSAFQGALLALLKQACRAVSGREAKAAELQPLMDHWPLFYRGCLGSVGVLKEWLVRTVAAALRKGDARLTLDRVREHELVEARLAEMATDIVAGEQQVELDFRLPRAITQFASDGERGGSRSGKCRRSEPPSHPTDKHASRNSQTET